MTPVESVVPEPLLGDKVISPVVVPPTIKVCILVVAIVPAEVRYVAPVAPETDAVGVPELTFKNPNLADEDEVPPNKTSIVELPG